MPILSLSTSTEIEQPKQEMIAKFLTELTSHHLRKNKEVTVVNIVPNHGVWFGVNGVITSSVYQLSIFITEGTNTENEITSWLRETWKFLKNELGILNDAVCYTSVINNDSLNWGFNGVNQFTRNKPNL